ncbi:MAG TPA: hypothetical protein DEQ38_13655 [Elusimicrobia bacterium]|nr:MAG: hypothetical protein A2089_13285 [Elusimicrobia bacterium GWD2_63_28]HCC49142.1 hypothetical protein [Elusimicrobiota bacterium]
MTAPALLAALLFAGPAAAAPPEPAAPQAAITRAEAEAIARALTAPAVYVARWGQAAVMAKVRLLRQLRERFPRRETPDAALVRVCLRLTLRLNNTWLEAMAGKRVYPGQEDFDRFTAAGLAALKKYTDGLDREHLWGPVDDRAAQDILDRELKRGLNRLPVYRGRGYPPEPPPSPEEKEYLPG